MRSFPRAGFVILGTFLILSFQPLWAASVFRPPVILAEKVTEPGEEVSNPSPELRRADAAEPRAQTDHRSPDESLPSLRFPGESPEQPGPDTPARALPDPPDGSSVPSVPQSMHSLRPRRTRPLSNAKPDSTLEQVRERIRKLQTRRTEMRKALQDQRSRTNARRREMRQKNKQISRLQSRIQQLEEQNETLRAQLTRMQRRLAKGNDSRPPQSGDTSAPTSNTVEREPPQASDTGGDRSANSSSGSRRASANNPNRTRQEVESPGDSSSLHRDSTGPDTPGGNTVSELLTRAETMLKRGRLEAFDRLIEELKSDNDRVYSPVHRSRLHYLEGRRSLADGEPDRAFFRLMEAIKAAPDSRWARRARTSIEREL